MLGFVHNFNEAIALIFLVAYFYQLVYLFVGLAQRRWGHPTPEAGRLHRFAAVISARNEANVIAGLIRSLKAQNYPAELLDIYVVADNCTDDTAQVAKAAGAFVYQRFNQSQVGKGYALDYLFRRLHTEGRDDYEGYFIFDADNYVDPSFVSEMNKTFDHGDCAAISC